MRQIPQKARGEVAVQNERKAVLVWVRGRVQGVSFRVWTREEAERLSLSGWVRNEPDGSVKALIAGPESRGIRNARPALERPAGGGRIRCCLRERRSGTGFGRFPDHRLARIDEPPYASAAAISSGPRSSSSIEASR
jgi:acylphosphatase